MYFADISVKQFYMVMLLLFLFRLKGQQRNVNFIFSKLKCEKIKLFFLFVLPAKPLDLVT